MKTLKYITMLLLASMLFGCEDMDHSYTGDFFVSFNSESVSEKENAKVISIPVMVSDKRTEEVTVTFSVEGKVGATEGVNFTVLNSSTTLTFLPEEGVKYIQIAPVDDLAETGDKVIEVAIVSNSKNYMIGVPGPDAKFAKCTVTIKEDDCALKPELFSGKITGLEDATTGGWWNDAESKCEWEFVSENSGVFVFTVKGFWYAQALNSGSNSWYSSESEITFLPVRVTINLSNPAAPTYSLAPDKVFEENNADAWGVFVKEVNNEPLTIDVCGRYLELPYTVTNTSWAHNYLFTLKFQF